MRFGDQAHDHCGSNVTSSLADAATEGLGAEGPLRRLCVRHRNGITEPRQRFSRSVEGCCLIDLFVIETTTADSNTLLPKHVCHASLGDAVPIADPLSGIADLVSVHNVDDVFGGQEALGSGIWTVLDRSGWSCWCFSDPFAQVSATFTEMTEVRVSSYCLHQA